MYMHSSTRYLLRVVSALPFPPETCPVPKIHAQLPPINLDACTQIPYARVEISRVWSNSGAKGSLHALLRRNGGDEVAFLENEEDSSASEVEDVGGEGAGERFRFYLRVVVGGG